MNRGEDSESPFALPNFDLNTPVMPDEEGAPRTPSRHRSNSDSVAVVLDSTIAVDDQADNQDKVSA